MTEDSDQEYVMGYECPKCEAIGGHTRVRFGPPGDGKNLERYCRECSHRFLTCNTDFVNRIESGGDSSTTEDSKEAELRSKERPNDVDETGVEPPKPPEPDAWLLKHTKYSSTPISIEREKEASDHIDRERLFAESTIKETIRQKVTKEEMPFLPMNEHGFKQLRKEMEEVFFGEDFEQTNAETNGDSQ